MAFCNKRSFQWEEHVRIKSSRNFQSEFSAISVKLLQLLCAAVAISNRRIFLIAHETDFLLKTKSVLINHGEKLKLLFFSVDSGYNSILIITSRYSSTRDNRRLYESQWNKNNVSHIEKCVIMQLSCFYIFSFCNCPFISFYYSCTRPSTLYAASKFYSFRKWLVLFVRF